LVPAERAALRRVRRRRLQALLGGAGAVLLTLFSVGCPEPADLENAGQYQPPAGGGSATTGGSASSGSATGGSAAMGEPCEVACVTDIFQKSQTLCALCHNNKGLMSSMLDISSPGFTGRLRNVAAKHGDLGMGGGPMECPTGDKLIDTATPANSWLLKKIDGAQGTCGTPMPSTGTLSADQKTCIHTYVSCVTGAAPTGTGGSAAGGSGNGGTGGT
jgi:hypothetical protein